MIVAAFRSHHFRRSCWTQKRFWQKKCCYPPISPFFHLEGRKGNTNRCTAALLPNTHNQHSDVHVRTLLMLQHIRCVQIDIYLFRERGEVLISSWEDYWKVMVAGLRPKSVQNPVSHQTGWITEIPSHKLEKDLLPFASEKRIWFSLLALSKTLCVCCGTLSWFWSIGFTQLSGVLAGEENSWQANAQRIIVFLSINLIRFLKSRCEIQTITTQLFASFVKSAALTWFIILLQQDLTCYDLIIKSKKIKYGNKLLEDL